MIREGAAAERANKYEQINDDKRAAEHKIIKYSGLEDKCIYTFSSQSWCSRWVQLMSQLVNV